MKKNGRAALDLPAISVRIDKTGEAELQKSVRSQAEPAEGRGSRVYPAVAFAKM